MADSILVINAGSSSLKFSVFEWDRATLALQVDGQIGGIGGQARFKAKDRAGALIAERQWTAGDASAHEPLFRFLLDWIEARPDCGRLRAAGHRVVHGGPDYSAPVVLDPAILARLETFGHLAPLHQPHNLRPIRTLESVHPGLPQVACFDTAFHRTNPPVAQLFPLPRRFAAEGIRRYGFHGLSYEYIARRLPELDPAAARGRTIVAHLGNGSSMCALVAGRSVASSMGFTAVDGLMMGTRSGSLDPGLVLHLMRDQALGLEAMEALLYKQSGLLGVSGISNDMRELLASGHPHAAEAIDLYCYRINQELGSLAAAAAGIDALVFTAGIGENAAPVRSRVCRLAAWLGIAVDEAANLTNGPLISGQDSKVQVWVIPTNEEQMIAHHTVAAVGLAA